MAKAKFSPAYTRLRKLLVEGRVAAGLKQAELAKLLGRPQSYVSKVETGERRLDVIEFADYASAVGGDPVKLLKRILSS